MIARSAHLWRCQRGASAAEFAIVLPLLILLLFGIIDAGRFLWAYNQAEKATQVGARMAAVTNVLSPGLIDEDYAGRTYGGPALKPGDVIPAEALGVVVCNSSGCSCDTNDGPCPATVGTMDAMTFAAIVARMNLIDPSVTAANVEVKYSGSGLGETGNPPLGGGGGSAPVDSIEISPLITVSLRDMEFRPISLLLAAALTMPDFRTTITTEDASGVYSE